MELVNGKGGTWSDTYNIRYSLIRAFTFHVNVYVIYSLRTLTCILMFIILFGYGTTLCKWIHSIHKIPTVQHLFKVHKKPLSRTTL